MFARRFVNTSKINFLMPKQNWICGHWRLWHVKILPFCSLCFCQRKTFKAGFENSKAKVTRQEEFTN
jgi:hypothetical protein